MEFELEPNLRRIALIALAKSIWDKKEMKKKLKYLFYSNPRTYKILSLNYFIKEVTGRINQSIIPAMLYKELLFVVAEMGLKIYGWFRYLKKVTALQGLTRKELYDYYMKNIFWTHYGTINEIKTIRSWLKTPGTDIIKIYKLACCFGSEKFINEVWYLMPKDLRVKNMVNDNLPDRNSSVLPAYWNRFRRNDFDGFVTNCKRKVYEDHPEIFDEDQSVAVNMFRVAVRKGYASSVRYFWTILSEEEKEKNLNFCLHLACDRYSDKCDTEMYRRGQHSEIILFLLGKMSDDHKSSLLDDEIDYYDEEPSEVCKYKSAILQMFTEMWPFQESLFLFMKSWPEFFETWREYFNLIELINHKMHRFYDKGLPVRETYLQRLLHNVWRTTPLHYKQEMNLDDVIRSLIWIWDAPGVKLFLNNSMMMEKKSKSVVSRMHEKLVSFIEEDNMKLLMEYVEAIAIPTDLNEKTRIYLKELYFLILNSANFKSVDEFLGINRENAEYVQTSEGLIDTELITFYFIKKNRLDDADQFLNWKFQNESRILDFKTTFTSRKFTTDHIYKVWITESNAKEKCDKFLLWFLTTENAVITFKTNKIVGEIRSDPAEILHRKFLENDISDTARPFLTWCGLNQDEIDSWISKTVDKHCNYRFMKCMKKGSIEEAKKLLRWCGVKEEFYNEFMSKFMVSPEGMHALKLFLGKYCTEHVYDVKSVEKETREKIREFVKFFIAPLDNFDKLKKDLTKWARRSLRHYVDYKTEPSRECDDSEIEWDDDDNKVHRNLKFCERNNYIMFLDELKLIEQGREGT